MGRGSCDSSGILNIRGNLKKKGCKRQVHSDTLAQCILFEVGWPVHVHWQVNRGLCLAASVGTSFVMCKYCTVFIAFTEATHFISAVQLKCQQKLNNYHLMTRFTKPDNCWFIRRKGRMITEYLVHSSMFTKRPLLVLFMALKYICCSSSQVHRREVCIYFIFIKYICDP